jgi:hypothetical protein
MAKLQLDPDELRPLVSLVVQEVLEALDAERAKLGERLAFTEPEASALLGIERRQLAVFRRAGKIEWAIGPRRMPLYTRAQLLAFLAARKFSPKE